MEHSQTEHEPQHDNAPGAEGGSSESTEELPAVPTDDDAEVGDTDQHSGSDA